MCLAKKKQIAVISITEAKLAVERVCDLSDQVRAQKQLCISFPVQEKLAFFYQVTLVSMDGNFVCAALASHYVMFNVSSGDSQELFPFEGCPAVARIAKEEFLLSAPGGLGMFVTAEGVSQRPPIQWSSASSASSPASVSAFAFHSPHIVALGEDVIGVYR